MLDGWYAAQLRLLDRQFVGRRNRSRAGKNRFGANARHNFSIVGGEVGVEDARRGVPRPVQHQTTRRLLAVSALRRPWRPPRLRARRTRRGYLERSEGVCFRVTKSRFVPPGIGLATELRECGGSGGRARVRRGRSASRTLLRSPGQQRDAHDDERRADTADDGDLLAQEERRAYECHDRIRGGKRYDLACRAAV
jgi:hypothetical protein